MLQFPPSNWPHPPASVSPFSFVADAAAGFLTAKLHFQGLQPSALHSALRLMLEERQSLRLDSTVFDPEARFD